MDFTLIKKLENESFCYKLLRANFYRGYYVIISQSKDTFSCGSIYATREEADELFSKIASNATEPHKLCDILRYFEVQKV